MLAAAAMIPANDARAQTVTVTLEGDTVTFTDQGGNEFAGTADITTRPADNILTLEADPAAAEKVTVCAITNVGTGVGTREGADGASGVTVTRNLSIASNNPRYNYRIYVTTGAVVDCTKGNVGNGTPTAPESGSLVHALARGDTNFYILTVNVPVSTATEVMSVVAVPTSLVEGSATTSTITVTLDSTVPSSQSPVTLPYVFSGITTSDFSYIVDGTATTGLTGDLVFEDIVVADGPDVHVDSKTIVVTALADDTVEAGGETLKFKLTAGPGTTSGYNGVAVDDGDEVDITISDTGPPTTVSVSIPTNTTGYMAGTVINAVTGSIDENGGMVEITVALDRPLRVGDPMSGDFIEVPYVCRTSNVEDEDYTIALPGIGNGPDGGRLTAATGCPNGMIQFNVGDQSKTVRISANNNFDVFVPDPMSTQDEERIIFDLLEAAIPLSNSNEIAVLQPEDVRILFMDDDVAPTMVESITVNPASIREAEGEAIITVSLDNAAVDLIVDPDDGSGTAGTGDIDVEVTFASPTVGGATLGTETTGDYTAECRDTADDDYAACTVDSNGVVTLVYSPGQQTKTIRITGRDDSEELSEDEGPETFTAEVTGTEEEGTGTTSVVGLPSTASVTVTINEITVEMEEVKTEVETLATLIGAEQVGTISGLIRSRFSAQASSGVASLDTPSSVLAGGTTKLSLHHNPQDMGDMLGGLALEHSASADGGGAYAVWVRGQYSSMEGDPTVNGITVDYDGDSTGLGIGAEKNTGSYVAGVAVNWLTTDLDISSSSDNTTISKYEESLVMVAPYLSLRRGARTFWFSGGYGIGDADATLEENEGKASADVEVSFASAGADFVLSERGKNRIVGGLSVLGTRKVVDPLNFAAADVVIPKITLNTFRAQGELTYSRTVQAGEGRVVRPYIGVATLHDAGDRINDDSHAMDLRGGVDFDGTRFDVSLEASTELLREDHKSWSVSGSARYQFDPVGRGASLSLDGIGGDASDIGLEGGYGMMMRQVHRDALLTPFAGIRHGSESGEFSSGMRLAVGNDMNADLRAARAFRNDEDTLKLNFRQAF